MACNLFKVSILIVLYILQILCNYVLLATPDSVKDSESKVNSCKRTCVSKECIKYAGLLLDQIDWSISPCDDFYEFVCSNYPRNTYIINEDFIQIPLATDIKFQMLRQVHDLLMNDTVKNAGTIAAKRKQIYQSCLNSESTEMELKALHRKISSSIKNWPNTDKNSTVDDWIKDMILLGGYGFVTVNVRHVNFKKLRQFSEIAFKEIPAHLFFMSPITTIEMSSNEGLFIEDFLRVSGKNPNDFLEYIFSELGFNETLSQAITQDVMRLDRGLKEIMTVGKNAPDKDVTTLCNSTNRWCRILSSVIDATGSDLNLMWDQVTIKDVHILEQFDSLLQRESKEAIANYLAVNFLVSNAVTMNHFIGEINHVEGYDPMLPDHKSRCIYFIIIYFPYIVVQDYIDSYVGEKKLNLSRYLFQSVINASIDLSRSSKVESDFISEFVEYMSGIFVTNDLHMKYIQNNLDLGRFNAFRPLFSSDYFTLNLVESRRFKVFDSFKNYREGFFFQTLTYENLFEYQAYSADEQITYGLARLLELTQISSPYFYFGTFAMWLGHEIGHSINIFIVSNKNILKKNSVDIVEGADRCLENLYDKFTIPQVNISVNGKFTLKENFCDITAFLSAYKGFMKDNAKASVEIALPGLAYTKEHMFFVSHAQSYCEFGDLKTYKRYVTNSHSPSKYRVNGKMMNSERFSDIFNCSSESTMNLNTKCNVWYN